MLQLGLLSTKCYVLEKQQKVFSPHACLYITVYTSCKGAASAEEEISSGVNTTLYLPMPLRLKTRSAISSGVVRRAIKPYRTPEPLWVPQGPRAHSTPAGASYIRRGIHSLSSHGSPYQVPCLTPEGPSHRSLDFGSGATPVLRCPHSPVP